MSDGLHGSGRRHRRHGGNMVSKLSSTAETFKNLQGPSHDYISDSYAIHHGKRFKTFAEWCGPKYNLFIQQMIKYANYVKEQKSEDSSAATPTAPAPILFQAGEGDLPLLPPPVQGVRSEEIAKSAKEIIRAYFLKHYRKSHNNFFC